MDKKDFKKDHFYYIKGSFYDSDFYEILMRVLENPLFSSPAFKFKVMASNSGIYRSNDIWHMWNKSEGLNVIALDNLIEAYEVPTKDFPLYIGWPKVSFDLLTYLK